MLTADDLRKAMRHAFHLGQTYWMYADSESFVENQKADSVQAKFNELVEETVAAAGVVGTSEPEETDEPTPAMREAHRKHAEWIATHGVSVGRYDPKRDQTPMPSPLDSESEG